MATCHTGVIDGKFVEGHVPARDILNMHEQSDLIGIAVPGMPVGAQGMEWEDRQDPYRVIGLDGNGNTRVLTQYPH